jgi:hypothetical protein
MAITGVVDKFLGFLRGGYPAPLTPGSYLPLLALLPRRLTDDDAALAVAELTSGGYRPVDLVDIRVAVTRITGELASDADTGRITRLLLARGFPVSARRPQAR